MTNWILRWVISGIALAIVASIPGLGISYDSIGGLAEATIVIGLVNSLVRPVVGLFTMPLNCMSLGMFGFILNGLLFWATQLFVPTFHVKFGWGILLGPVLMSLIGGVLGMALPDKKKDK